MYEEATGWNGSRRRLEQEDAALAKEIPSLSAGQLARFEQVVLPHLDAAFNLARWLTGNDHDAEDLVQEAYLRAYRFFDRFHGDDGRPGCCAWSATLAIPGCGSTARVKPPRSTRRSTAAKKRR